MKISITLTEHEICPEESFESQKNGGYKGSFVAFIEFMFFSSTQKVRLQIFVMNWQTEGINRNYRSVKFEGISPKKTRDIHVKVLHFCDRTTRYVTE